MERGVQGSDRKKGRIHVGRIFAIVVEKNAELADGHPLRKFKARVVLQGNNVKDELSYEALFQDLGSAPASMSAAKFADFHAAQASVAKCPTPCEPTRKHF